MPADFGPLNVHDTQRVYDQIRALSDLGLSQNDIYNFLAQSKAQGRSALDEYMNAAGMNIAQSFQPQFDQARSYLGANPLLADSGYANRLNRQLLTDLATRESGAFNTAAADQANQQVGYLQSLQGQRIGARQGLAGQAFDTILKPPQKQPWWKQAAGAVVGAGVGALTGGLVGAGVGAASALSSPGGGQYGYSQSGIQGGYSGYVPGQSFYPNSLYPAGGYSEPTGGNYPTMMRRT